MLVPGVGSGYALFQSHFWFYVQGLYQFFVAQDGALDVSGAGWGVLHFGLVSYGPFEGSDQVVDARFSSCRYVDRVIAREGQCLYDSRCDVSGVDKIPRLIAIAIDSDWFSLGQKFAEYTDHAAFSFFSLPFAVDVGKAEHRRIEAVQFMVDPHILFRRHLRNTIG